MDGLLKVVQEKEFLPIFIVRMLHIYNNIPNDIIYLAFIGETLRIAC